MWHNSWQAARTPDRHLRLAGAQIPVEVIEGLALRCPSVSFRVERVGKTRFSHDGFRALIDGRANVACTSGKIAFYDAKDYRDAHGNLPLGYRVAWDAYALYVHPNNPVRVIEIKDFKRILRREIHSWNSVGGPPEHINLYGPPRSSRGGALFMQVAKLFIADPHWKQIQRPGDIIDAVKADPYAIGMTQVGYSQDVPYLALRGVIDPKAYVPDFDALEADKWPILKTIWLWTPDPPDQAAADLINYVYSEKGQAAIKATGYTPIPRDRGETRVRLTGLPASQTTPQSQSR